MVSFLESETVFFADKNKSEIHLAMISKAFN